MAGDAEPEVNLGLNDYRTVLRLMDQYLPVDQLAGKIITPDMLRELGLLEDSPLDNLLQKCLATESSPAPDNSSGEI
jgi:hypothetical protein